MPGLPAAAAGHAGGGLLVLQVVAGLRVAASHAGDEGGLNPIAGRVGDDGHDGVLRDLLNAAADRAR